MRTPPLGGWRAFALGSALLVLTGVAIAVRSPGLGLEVLSSDESFSWRLTQYVPNELIRRTGADVHPPLYYLLLKAWIAGSGTSPAALRSLSLLFGVLCVPLIYTVYREAWLSRLDGLSPPTPPAWPGALLAAMLMAVHTTQVAPSRNARMYALGTFLAGLTAWMLLRALRSPKKQGVWWATYGVAVAAFCYTHYYAFFTVLAQAVFVAGLAGREWRATRSRQAAGLVVGLLFAGAIAFLLYFPWLEVLRGQVRQVRQEYWISPISAHTAEANFFSWATGFPYQGGPESRLLIVLVGAAVIATAWQGDRAGWFFLLQWALPWVLSLGVSAISGRTIFLERYMAFAHFSFLAHVATVVCRSLPGRSERTLVACALVGCCLYGLWDAMSRYPRETPAMAAAVEFLKENCRPGDLVLTDSAHSLNRIRYYAAQRGMAPTVVKCTVPWQGRQGHFTHVASIESEDVWWESRSAELGVLGRVWWATESGGPGPVLKNDFRAALQQTFEDGGMRFTLILYDRQPK